VRVLFHSEDFVGAANNRGAGDGWLADFGGAPIGRGDHEGAPLVRGDHEGTDRAAPPPPDVPVAAAVTTDAALPVPALASALAAGKASLGTTLLSGAVGGSKSSNDLISEDAKASAAAGGLRVSMASRSTGVGEDGAIGQGL